MHEEMKIDAFVKAIFLSASVWTVGGTFQRNGERSQSLVEHFSSGGVFLRQIFEIYFLYFFVFKSK